MSRETMLQQEEKNAPTHVRMLDSYIDKSSNFRTAVAGTIWFDSKGRVVEIVPHASAMGLFHSRAG